MVIGYYNKAVWVSGGLNYSVAVNSEPVSFYAGGVKLGGKIAALNGLPVSHFLPILDVPTQPWWVPSNPSYYDMSPLMRNAEEEKLSIKCSLPNLHCLKNKLTEYRQ